MVKPVRANRSFFLLLLLLHFVQKELLFFVYIRHVNHVLYLALILRDRENDLNKLMMFFLFSELFLPDGIRSCRMIFGCSLLLVFLTHDHPATLLTHTQAHKPTSTCKTFTTRHGIQHSTLNFNTSI